MPSDRNDPNRELYSIAVVTVDESAFPEMRRALATSFRTTLASTEEQIKALVEDPNLHGILFDLDSIGEGARDGIDVLKEIRAIREEVVLVAMTGSQDRSIPLRASQAGADEFFLAPVNYTQLEMVFTRAIEKRALENEGRRLLEQVESKTAFCSLIGGSAAMQKVYQAIQAVAGSNTSVCLNCSALPETLIESELFGYEKGAFTGADMARPGLIETAHNGTLFLDEIPSLNPNLQSKLLRALQERSVQRLGGRSTKKIDFRLICATNEDLEDLVRKGRFREDLYYRINVVPILVPPLRDREGDLALLVDHFLRIYCASAKKPVKRMQPDVMEILEDYAWPGNVRELENIVQRLVVMNDSPVITAEQLPQMLLYSSAASHEAILIPEEGVDFDAEMQRIEIAYLNAALRRSGGKKSAAAALLRIDPQRMKYLCRKLKLQNG
jgi:DNA-binding NtrC family response regulator